MVNWCGTSDLLEIFFFLSLIVYKPVSSQDSTLTNPSSLHPASCPRRMSQSPTLSRLPGNPLPSLPRHSRVLCFLGHTADVRHASTSSRSRRGGCALRHTCGGRRLGWTTYTRLRATLRAMRTRRARSSCRSCIKAWTARCASSASSISTVSLKRASTTWTSGHWRRSRNWSCRAVSGARNEHLSELGIGVAGVLYVNCIFLLISEYETRSPARDKGQAILTTRHGLRRFVAVHSHRRRERTIDSTETAPWRVFVVCGSRRSARPGGRTTPLCVASLRVLRLTLFILYVLLIGVLCASSQDCRWEP